MPRVAVRFFAAHREAAGRPGVEVALPPGASVGDLRKQLRLEVPALAESGLPALVAVNGEFADDARTLRPGDRVALFPPVSGG